MRSFLFLPFLAALSMNIHTYTPFALHTKIDTVGITHVQDGLVSEWPDSIFQTDKGTNIRYAADNDAKNLYVAMKIQDFPIQMKMMRQGMNFYIDLKGKKKENRGIEFPIKRESETSGFGNNQQGSFDKKAMRSRFAIFMLTLKAFGFNDSDPVTQALQTEGSVNLAYSWDAEDVMYIEYLIPLNMLGDAASLNQKTISIGWKINGVDVSSFGSGVTSSTSTVVTTSSNGRTTSRTLPSTTTTSPPPQTFDSMMEEKSFWMKYIFH